MKAGSSLWGPLRDRTFRQLFLSSVASDIDAAEGLVE
jgi:hypothetical protein